MRAPFAFRRTFLLWLWRRLSGRNARLDCRLAALHLMRLRPHFPALLGARLRSQLHSLFDSRLGSLHSV
jgi:hypothetical protein